MFPEVDEDRGLIGLNLETFLKSRQLQYVDELHIVMKLFWVRDLDPLGYVQGATNEHAHPYILQLVLDKLKESKAGRDGPVLRSLTLEDLSEWRPNGRKNIKREDYCLAQYQKMAQDAGVETLRWKWPSGSGYTTCL